MSDVDKMKFILFNKEYNIKLMLFAYLCIVREKPCQIQQFNTFYIPGARFTKQFMTELIHKT